MSLQPFSVEKGFATLNDSAGDTHYLQGAADPSQAPGVPAPISSQYNRINGTASRIYIKTGLLDTDWAAMASSSGAEELQTPSDGQFSDGLFPWQAGSTTKSDALDDVNEVLAALAPTPAPSLSQINMVQTGVAAKLSFGVSNVIAGYNNVTGEGAASPLDINGLFSPSGDTKGVFGSELSAATGTLNPQVAANAKGSFTAAAFGNGDSGTLSLEVNGVVVHTVDLAVFVSGNAYNGNGSGFTLSAATPVQFESGVPFPAVKYRAGSWRVAGADIKNGYNYIRVTHNTGSVSVTNFIDFVVDTDGSTLSASGGALTNLQLTGTKHLSGVKYDTGGTVEYNVTIQNIHRNVYGNGNVISFPGTRLTAASLSLGNITDETQNEVLAGVLATIQTGSRILNQPIQLGVTATHPLKATLTNAQQITVNGILLDATAASSTALSESFDDENYRLVPAAYNTQADLSMGVWDSTKSIAVASPDAEYRTGLLCYNGALRYPTQGLDAGDFRNVTDGNANGPLNGLDGNPNYSGETGDRVYYRKFVNNSGLTKANFKLRFTGTGSFASVASGATGQNLTVEVKFPDGSISTGTGWMDAYGDFSTNNWVDGAGCRNATAGAGRAMGVDWGATIGTKSIAANESIIVRIKASSTFTGSVDSLVLTWL